MIDRRLLGFLVAGGINTVFGYCAYGALIMIGVVPHVAVVCSTAAGILFNFQTTGTVFRSRDPRRLPRFIAVYGVNLILNMSLLELAMRGGAGAMLAQAIALLVVVPLTFLAMRRFVFSAAPEQTP